MGASSDVVIVGGGIVGISTAYYLGQAGVSTLLVEKGSVGSHASGFAYGGLGSLGASAVDGSAFAVAAEGMKLHKELAEMLPQQTSINTEYRLRPSLSLAFEKHEADAAKSSLPLKQSHHGYSATWCEPETLKKIEPRISDSALGGVYVEGTADVNPYRLVLAMAQATEQAGTKILHGNVTGMHREGDGYRVSLNGDELTCSRVVLAMGPWSGQASPWLGIPIKIRPLKGQILRLRAPGPPLQFSLGWGGNYATTKPDGLLWAGTTEEEAGFDEIPTSGARNQIMAALLKMAPSLAEARLVRQTACLRPISADKALMLGEMPGWNGTFMATGAGRSGIVLGPALGRITADLITTGKTDIPITSFDPKRFMV